MREQSGKVLTGKVQSGKITSNTGNTSKTGIQLLAALSDWLNTRLLTDHLGRSPALLFHMGVSILLLYIAERSGLGTKVLMAPYAVYLIWARRIEFIPALIFLSAGTTALSYVIMCSTMVGAWFERDRLTRSGLRTIFYLMTALSVICLSLFGVWLYQSGMDITGTLDKFKYYFSVFPLFYGYLLARDIGEFDLSVFTMPLTIGFLMVLVGVSPVGGVFRILSFFLVLVLTYFAVSIFIKPKIIQIPAHFVVGGGLYVLFVVLAGGIKFNQIFAVLIAGVLVFSLVRLRRETVETYLKGRYIILLMLAVTALGVFFSSRVDMTGTEIDYTDIVNYPNYMISKLFADRGVLWAGAVETIISQVGFFPQKESLIVSYEIFSGELLEADFGAHNIILELILAMGWIVGGGLLIVLGLLVVQLSRALIQFMDRTPLLYLTAVVLAVLVSGGLLGQYIMMPNFGFLMFLSVGMCLGIGERLRQAEQGEDVDEDPKDVDEDEDEDATFT